MPKDKQTKL